MSPKLSQMDEAAAEAELLADDQLYIRIKPFVLTPEIAHAIVTASFGKLRDGGVGKIELRISKGSDKRSNTITIDQETSESTKNRRIYGLAGWFRDQLQNMAASRELKTGKDTG